ncbi:MAG: 2-dehydropantoate 2-reductase [Aquificae bacterium]|nr:2-dehydropantoate 2-reductase [Aquificota bacterium]
MRFWILGVGAIGSAYLAFLTRAGHDAVGLVRRNPVSEISVSGIWGSFSVPVRTFTKPEEIPFGPDVLILSVKSYDTKEALLSVRDFIPKETLIMVAQNGYGNYETALELFPENPVILSRVIFGAKREKPGSVRITVCADDVVIGDPRGKIPASFLEELAKLFSSAGIPTRHSPDVYKYLIDKLVYNSALNPLGALFEKTYGELAENPKTRELMNEVIKEIFLVIKERNLPSFFKSAEDYTKVFYEKLIPPTASHYPSMLEDIRKGKTEIDALNGAVVRLAHEAGLRVPTNELITRMVKAKELFNLKDAQESLLR